MNSSFIIWFLMTGVITLCFVHVANSQYDLNTCWQHCLDSVPSVRSSPVRSDKIRVRRGRSRSRSYKLSDRGRSSSSSSSSSESHEDLYQKFIDGNWTANLLKLLGEEAQNLRDAYGAETINFLLDASFSHKHEFSSETAAIWRLQKNLAFMMSVMLEAGDIGTASVTIFDHNYAWTCPQLSCITACDMGAILPTLDQFSASYDSGKKGNIQAACSLGFYNQVQNAVCNTTGNSMAVAVVNSDIAKPFHTSRTSHLPYSDQSDLSCGSYPARYLVGTHSAQGSDARYWASRNIRPRYIPDDWQTMATIEELSNCMYSSCCAAPSVPNLSNCIKATGFNGDYFGPFQPY